MSDSAVPCRADGLQPKTIETFRQMRLADPLLQRGVRVYDIAFWRSTVDEPLHRLGREVHYPPVIDVLDPYILLVHQGMVESLFIEDLKKRGVEVRRNTAFDSYSVCDSKGGPLQVNCRTNVTQDRKTLLTQYLVGCGYPPQHGSRRRDTGLTALQAMALIPRSERASRRRNPSACRRLRSGVCSTES